MSEFIDRPAQKRFQRRALAGFTDVDFLYQESQQRLLERFSAMKVPVGERVVVAAEHTRDAVSLDAHGFANNTRYVEPGDALATLPKGAASVVLSNLAHSIEDMAFFFSSAQQALSENGLLLFSLLGPRTLFELRQAFAHDPYPHVHRFYDMHDVGDLLLHQGFESPVMEAAAIQVNYAALSTLWSELRQMGAQCVLPQRRKGLQGKASWQTMLSNYPQQDNGKYPVTIELVIGHAWKSSRTADSPRDQEVTVAIDQIKRKSA